MLNVERDGGQTWASGIDRLDGKVANEKWGQCILYMNGTSSGHHMSAIDQMITHIIQNSEPGHRAEGTELGLAGIK